MCGLVACRTEAPAAPLLVEALARLEYRGYDSVGLAVSAPDGSVHTMRTVHRVGDLAARLPEFVQRTSGGIGIGHSRWATHGEVSERNAHPHQDCSGRVVLAHNGVITNAEELRAELEARGHSFSSSVDSEVVAHLVEEHLAGARRPSSDPVPSGVRAEPQMAGAQVLAGAPVAGAMTLPGEARAWEVTLVEAVTAAVARLEGSWALVVLDAGTGDLVVTSHHCPLVVGESPRGTFVASDISAVAGWVTEFRVLADDDVVSVGESLDWFRNGVRVDLPAPVPCTVVASDLDLGRHPDFMAKEIAEQPEVAQRVLATWGAAAGDPQWWHSFELPPVHRVLVVACGTSLNAGRLVGGVLGQLGGLPVQFAVASECEDVVVEPGTLLVALSQSGETADVLRAVDHLTRGGAPLLAVTNNAHSALGRRADAVLPVLAGVEVGVAATKTFTAQVVAGSCLALSLLAAHDRISRSAARQYVADLVTLPAALDHAILASTRAVPRFVEAHRESHGFIFLGRGNGHVCADEGALKLKELTYRWAESHPAGELKHGPLALVEFGTPVLVVDDARGRLETNIAEVRARGGHVIRIGGAGSDIPALNAVPAPRRTGHDGTASDWIGPLGAVVAMQVFARHMALALGRDVDKPRNLAKSVTVE